VPGNEISRSWIIVLCLSRHACFMRVYYAIHSLHLSNLNLFFGIRDLILILLDQLQEAQPVLQLLETTKLLLQMLVIRVV